MTVRLRPGESQDELLRRFRKEVGKSGVLKAFRKKRWYVSKGEQRRQAKARGIRRARRKGSRTQSGRRGRRS